MTDLTSASYQVDYQRDRMFLVTRDNAFVPMSTLEYVTHTNKLQKHLSYSSRGTNIHILIRSGYQHFKKFTARYGDFGHDPYNHIGRRMRA